MENRRGIAFDVWVAAIVTASGVGGGCAASASKVEPREDVVVRRHALLASDVPGDIHGNEPALAVSPLDPNVIALTGCSDVSLSFDGGKTFSVNIPFVSPPGYGGGVCDGVVAFDSKGRLFLTYPLFKSSIPGGETELFVQQLDPRAPGQAVPSRLLDASGTECGVTGANPNQCPINVSTVVNRQACGDGLPGRTTDKPWMAVDARPACGVPAPARATRTCTPFQDTIYVSWLDSPCCKGPTGCDSILDPMGQSVVSSTDHGATWSLNTLSDDRDPIPSPSHLAVAANGDVYLAVHTATNQIVVYQSSSGSAVGFAGRSVAFAAPSAQLTGNIQQCLCPDSVCLSNPGKSCSFEDGHCPGPNCECGAANDCTPTSSCSNTPIRGWQPCPGRLQTTGVFSDGSKSPFIVTDPTNPNNVAVFTGTDPNHGVTARDNLDINYVIATSAASGALTWSSTPLPVTPNGAALPATNQIFPIAAGAPNSACVTAMYYDDRNPVLDSTGQSQLDVFVTVNPNLWGNAGWQTEKKLNSVSFDLSKILDADFAKFCKSDGSGYPGCVEPTGWRRTVRVGEYHGLLQARGAAWTTNDPATGGERVVFNYSDAIPPVVVPPGPVTVNTCRPVPSALGVGTATDPCGMPPLSTPAPIFPVLVRGMNTIAWSATDGAMNVGTGSQTVTVNDTTPPSITAPPTVDFAACDAGTVTVGQPTGSDDCNVQVTFSGQVVSKNGVTLNPPIAVVNGQVALGFGTYVVRWTASDGVNTSAPVFQTVTVVPHIQAAGNFTVDDSAFIKDANGSPGQILNSAAGQTHLGVSATSGSITSVANVDLANNAHVTGNIITAGVITGDTSHVTGTRTQNASVVLPPLPTLPTFPPPVGPNITVNNGSQTLTPGSYPTVTLNSGATLIMTAGDFFIQNFFINSNVNVRVQVTPNTRVYVQTQFAFRSPFVNSSGTLQPILVGFAGSSMVVETAFSGTLLAPNGSVTFGLGSTINYRGAFFAKNIEVRNNATLSCDDTVATPLPSVPPPATCSDGVKDGNETDVDCGGSCAACGNGKHCSLGSDCQNGSCVSGICQQPTGQVKASLVITADWGSGYCANVLLTNLATTSTKNWSVTVNTGRSTIYTSWNGNFPATTGTIAVTPGFTWNQVVAPGATNNTVGFCANRTPVNSGALPIVVSASGSF